MGSPGIDNTFESMAYEHLLIHLGSDIGLMDMAESFLAGMKRPLTVAAGRTMFATEGSTRNGLQNDAACPQV